MDVSEIFLPIGGGVVANTATKGLSNLILNQTAKTSVKAGLGGAGIDASMQVGTQIYYQAKNNNGFVDLRDIDLNYYSILFSGVAGATTVQSVIKSGKEILYSGKAARIKFTDYLNSKTINRKNKNFYSFLQHGWNIFKHLSFQGTNAGMLYMIKDATVKVGDE